MGGGRIWVGTRTLPFRPRRVSRTRRKGSLVTTCAGAVGPAAGARRLAGEEGITPERGLGDPRGPAGAGSATGTKSAIFFLRMQDRGNRGFNIALETPKLMLILKVSLI